MAGLVHWFSLHLLKILQLCCYITIIIVVTIIQIVLFPCTIDAWCQDCLSRYMCSYSAMMLTTCTGVCTFWSLSLVLYFYPKGLDIMALFYPEGPDIVLFWRNKNGGP